jgi:hypothetical protein
VARLLLARLLLGSTPFTTPSRNEALGGEKTMMVPSMLDNKGTKILAKSLFRELRGNGYSANQILGLTTELIDLVTQDLRDQSAAAAQAAHEEQVRATA